MISKLGPFLPHVTDRITAKIAVPSRSRGGWEGADAMGENTRGRVARLLQRKRGDVAYGWMFAAVAMVLAVSVAIVLHRNGVAATHQEQVLDCHAAAGVAHAHNADCYDAAGNLVCPLPVVELHVHDDSCYTETRELACGQEESAGHTHGDECYDESGKLTCGLEESAGHVHTDECYRVVRKLTCGKAEVTEAHVHGPGCFRTVTVDDGADEAGVDEAGAEDSDEMQAAQTADSEVADDAAEPDVLMPQQAFAHEFRDADGKLVLGVNVDAPEGALPDRTAMHAEWIDPEMLTKKQRAAVDEAIASKADGEVLDQQAVDITFVDAEGQKVKPAKKLVVTITSALANTVDNVLAGDVMVVHIDDLTEGQLEAQQEALDEGKTAEEAEPERTAEVIDNLSDQALAERNMSLGVDQLAFESDEVSTYVLATTSAAGTPEASDGETGAAATEAQTGAGALHADAKRVEVDVAYADDAGIPEDATLQVTEFEEQSAEYEAAWDAVTEQKQAEDDAFDESAFGMVAFDVSILDEEGVKVEPESPVSVSFKLKELPEEATEAGAMDSLEISHLDESAATVNVETVASVSDGSIQASGDSAQADFELGSFSTFTVNWNYNTTKTTVHYGYMQDGVFHEFEEQPNPTDTSTSDGWAYLIYDFHGTDEYDLPFEYNYAATYYLTQEATNPTTGTSVAPLLRYWDNSWRYYATSHGYAQNDVQSNNNWSGAANNSHLYVVYDKPSIQNGGSPTLSNDTPTPDAPDILKQSEEDGDGTNTLSLSITGSTSDLEVETLADVIVVLDLSSSMQNNIHNTSSTGSEYATNTSSRYYQAKQAVITLANNLYQKNVESGKNLIRMGLVTFAGNAQVRQPLTESKDTFLGAVNRISRYEGKGTNWEHAIKLANEMAVDSGRATFVVFVTDGEPTASQTRWGLSNARLESNIFLAGTTGGGIQYGWSHSVHGDFYDPFHFYLRSGTFGTTSAGVPGQFTENGVTLSGDYMNNHAAYDDAKSIVDHNKNFYVIAISSDVGTDALNGIIDAAGVPRSHGIPATNQIALTNAFNEIESQITGVLGWGDVQMTDGITDLTNIVSKVPLVDFGDEFTYWKSQAPEGWKTWTSEEKEAYQKGVEYAGLTTTPEGYDSWSDAQKAAFQKGKSISFSAWSDADRAAAHCQNAFYDEATGSVQWNMGSSFMLEDGVTYKVSFICWPSQEAYDILAKCRNDESYYDTLTAAQKSQIKRTGVPGNYSYTLKTNKDGANTTYKTATKTGNTITATGDPQTLYFGTVPDLLLAEQKIFIQKVWVNTLDERVEGSVNLGVIADGNEGAPFDVLTVSEAGGWKDSSYISTGLMKVENGAITLYETGHDFTLTEDVPGGSSYNWQLDTDTYRPMVITDASRGYETTTVILKKVTGDESYDYDILERDGTTHSYYQVTSSSNSTLTATNYRRSNLNLTKHVVDDSGKVIDNKYPDELFEFAITVNDPAIVTATDQDIWFSVQDAAGNTVAVETDAPYRETRTVAGAAYNPETDTYTYENEGKTYTLPAADGGAGGVMYTGYYAARNGTSITVKMKPTWNLRFTNLPTGTTYTITEAQKEGFACIDGSLTKPTGASNVFAFDSDTATATGEITQVNTEYQVAYTNRCDLLDIVIIKTDDSATPKNLGGATFKLYRLNEQGIYAAVGDGTAFAVPEEGYTYAGLVAGQYKLEEMTPPPGYIITKKEVLFTLSDDAQVITLAEGSDHAHVDENETNKLYVQNTPGAELPAAGGPGTSLGYLVGVLLMLLAAAGLVARRAVWCRVHLATTSRTP